MAQYQGRYEPARQTDEYGNPIHQSSGQNVNPVRASQTTGLYGTGIGGAGGEALSYGVGGGGGGQGQQQQQREHRSGEGGMLRRSGSSGSSSSEDDGEGGRRKKGLKEKIKEKIPGVGGKDEDRQDAVHVTPTTTAAGGYADEYHQSGQQQEEKKGIMQKIKEKLPSQH